MTASIAPREKVAGPGRRQQRGIAVILMMLLTGLSVTATIVGTSRYINSAQRQHLAASTQAVAKPLAWSGVEAVRLYLASLDKAAIEALGTGPITVDGTSSFTASVTSAPTEVSPGQYRMLVAVTGSGANSTATVEAVFDVVVATGGGCGAGGCSNGPGGITIRRGLDLSGNITFEGGEFDDNANVTVEGDVTMGGSVSGTNRMCVLKDEDGNGGNLLVRSNIHVNNVCVEGDLTMSGSASITAAEVTGNVTLSGATTIDNLLSNGDVSMTGGGASIAVIRTQGNVAVDCGGCDAGTIEAEGDVVWEASNAPVSIHANGDIAYDGDSSESGMLLSRGDVTLTGSSRVAGIRALGDIALNGQWGSGVYGQLDGQGGLSWTRGAHATSGTVARVDGGHRTHTVNVTADAGHTVSVDEVVVEDYRPEPLPEFTVDVHTLRALANYVFTYENGQRKVEVKGIHGIEDGDYILGDLRNGPPYKDVLCTSVSGGDNCTNPSSGTGARTICQGHSDRNGCISYSRGTWSLNGKSLAPGIAWFDGDLDLGNGTYFNTFLASGNISTSGGMTTYAINYAGYAAICQNNRSGFSDVAAAPSFDGMYPTAYCDLANGTMEGVSLGNVALTAGGFVGGSYVGGDISIGASNEIYGAVIAGNTLATTGSSDVHGQIIAAALGNPDSSNRWRGSTRVVFPDDRDGYNPTGNPYNPGGGGNPPIPAGAYLSWTRHN